MDAQLKKTIAFKFEGRTLRFQLATGLFSSYGIDAGTQFLLRNSRGQRSDGMSILDLGCGYGPIGLSLASAAPGSSATLADKDALAVEYSMANAALNGVERVTGRASLGYDDLPPAGFDLIAMNIPAKAGAPVIDGFLRDSSYFLSEGGMVAAVVINPLADQVRGTLRLMDAEVLFTRQNKGYALFHFRLRSAAAGGFEPAFGRGVYLRGRMSMDGVAIETFWGLPEFDTLNYSTAQLIRQLTPLSGAIVGRALAFNPGQGHLAVALWLALKPRSLVVAGRDLLALRATRRNLELNGCPAEVIQTMHVARSSDLAGSFDLMLGRLREDEGAASYLDGAAGLLELLGPDGMALIGSTATAAARLASRVRSKGSGGARELVRERGFVVSQLRR